MIWYHITSYHRTWGDNEVLLVQCHSVWPDISGPGAAHSELHPNPHDGELQCARGSLESVCQPTAPHHIDEAFARTTGHEQWAETKTQSIDAKIPNHLQWELEALGSYPSSLQHNLQMRWAHAVAACRCSSHHICGADPFLETAHPSTIPVAEVQRDSQVVLAPLSRIQDSNHQCRWLITRHHLKHIGTFTK